MTDYTIVENPSEPQEIIVTQAPTSTVVFSSVNNTTVEVTTSFLPLEILGAESSSVEVLSQPTSQIEIVRESTDNIVIESGQSLSITNNAEISTDPENILQYGTDNKLYVSPPSFETTNW